MAQGTTTPEVTRDSWTLVAAAGTSGLFQNTTGLRVLVREQTLDPTSQEKKGLVYPDEKGDVFATTPGIWVRLDKNAGQETSKATVAVIEY